MLHTRRTMGIFAFIRMLYAGDFCPYACFYVISFYDASAFQRKHLQNGSCGNGVSQGHCWAV